MANRLNGLNEIQFYCMRTLLETDFLGTITLFEMELPKEDLLI